MNLNYRNNLLLLGAGFTRNFGGFLASEMWAKIFSNPELDRLPEIKNIFRDEKNKFDFENIFSVVMQSSRYSLEGKSKFEKIIGRHIHLIATSYKQMSGEFFNNLINGIVLYGYLRKI